MNTTTRALMIVGLFFVAAATLLPQILPPNAAGVAAGHAHIYVTDQSVSDKFWTALGGVPLEQRGGFRGSSFRA